MGKKPYRWRERSRKRRRDASMVKDSAGDSEVHHIVRRT